MLLQGQSDLLMGHVLVLYQLKLPELHRLVRTSCHKPPLQEMTFVLNSRQGRPAEWCRRSEIPGQGRGTATTRHRRERPRFPEGFLTPARRSAASRSEEGNAQRVS